jgi:hypothetical protein
MSFAFTINQAVAIILATGVIRVALVLCATRLPLNASSLFGAANCRSSSRRL